MKKFVLAGVALAALAALPAAAQPRADGPARNAGPLTRASVQAAVQARFAKVDADRDGYVTRAEADARAAQARGERQERMAQRQARMAERRAGLFDRLDTDKNGSISRAEFDAHAAARVERRAERAADGGDMRGRRGMRHARMMRGHRMGMGAGRFGGPMFERLDADHDGRISLAEASARALEMFDRADADRNGTVTSEERRAARQRFRAGHQRRGG